MSVVVPLAVTASAPAKTILFGEHFVAYDEPVIVLAIDNQAYVTVALRKDKRIYVLSKDLCIRRKTYRCRRRRLYDCFG